MKHLKLFFALFAMLALGVGNAWGAEAEVYSADFTSVATHSYTQNKTFTLNSKSWTSSVSQVNGGVFYLGCNSNNKDKGVLNNNSTFSEIVTALKSVDSKYSASVSTAHAYAMLFDNAYTNVTRVSFGWAGGNNAFQVYLFGYSNSSWSLLKQTNYATSGAAVAGSVEWTGEATDYTKFAIVARPGTATSVTSSKTLRASTFKIYATEDAGGSETPDCTSITPTLSYESTTLLTGNNSSNPSITGNTGNGTVTYASSNTEVATVNESGVITALKAGTATITATIALSGEYCDGMATVDIIVKQLVSCAEIYNLADDATFVLKDFVVTYVNGKYTYIKDNEGGYGLIFTNSGEYGLKAGEQVASGKFEGKKDTYNGLVEIIPTTEVGDLGATSGIAPDPEVMNTNPTEDDMNKYVKFEDVTFASTGFSNKKVTGTINAGDITFYDQFVTSATFNTSKKYNVIGAVSIYNSTVQVNFISAEEVAEPTLNLTTTPIDFGKVAINSTNESSLQLSGSLLTKDITLSVEGDSYFTVSANSITPSEGSVNESITITYKPTVKGTHTATLKITSDELTVQTITLTGNAVEEYTVHFYLNDVEQIELAKTILSGNTLDALPEEPESCDPLTYPTFAGWTSAEIDGTTDVKPTMLDLSTPITSDCNYYAVFEKETVAGSSEEQTETINAASFAGITGTTERVLSANSSTWTWNKGSGTNIANYEEIRLYANHTMTISPKDGCDISKIVVDINTGKPVEAFADGGLSGASMSREGNTATLTPTSGDIVITQTNQSRVNSFVVTYTTSTTTYEYITSCAAVVPTCEITYDFAGGEGECTTDIVEKDTEYTLCATAPTKTGHTFLNWKDQHGTDYAAGATITSVTEDLTLTAQWQVNSYVVTWMSLGNEVSTADVEYNTQPTKPATEPSYTCGVGDKQFVGWTTEEIDGIGIPANLYTTEFPVVTEPITYHAVFASICTTPTTNTNTLLVTEKLSGYTSGSMKDDQENEWNYFAGGLEDAETYYLALRNDDGETSYIKSPKFAGTVQSIVAHVRNGSASKDRTVYLRSSAVEKPAEGDLGETSIPASNNSEVNLDFTSSFDKFYIQVSDGLQFHKIVVTSGIAIGDYIDYITSCDAMEVSIEVAEEVDFGSVKNRKTAEQSIAVVANNYEGTLAFAISGTDAAFFTAGTFADGKLPITYAPKAEGNHVAVLTITAGEVKATVNLIGYCEETVSGNWQLVTDASTLAVGDKVVIVAAQSNYAMSTVQKSNNRGQAEVTKDTDNNTITFGNDVQVLTLKAGKDEETFALYAANYIDGTETKNGYLYAASTSANHLKTRNALVEENANNYWTISIENNIATIKATSTSHNWLRYNTSNDLFSCYTSGCDDVCLYRKQNTTIEGESDNSSIPNHSDVTVNENAELSVNTEAEYDNMYINNGGTVNVVEDVTVNNLYIQTTMGTTTSGQLNTSAENITVNGDAFLDITLGKNGDPNQWHAFTVPFPVEVMNGVYDIEDNKLTNEVHYAIMDYHGDVRAQGKYGWKKYRGVLVPGTFYLITVDGERATYRFKKVKDAELVAANTKSLIAHTGEGKDTDKGWNGVGNPTLMHGKVAHNALILNPETYTYEVITASSAHFTVGTPFFIQAAANATMTIVANTNSSPAPARRAATVVEDIPVMLSNSHYTDRLYVSASEDATNEYEIGKDLAKMIMTNTPSVPQIFAQAYGTQLCMIDAPLVGNEATIALKLYAPADGEYTLSTEAQENTTVYLAHEGTIVWNLSMGEYPITLNQGDNAGYSLIVRRENAPTDVENVSGANNQTEKLIYNGNLYILHEGKIFNSTGRNLK